MLAHPRDAGELRPVGDLVQGQPQPELAGREGEALLEGEDVGPDVVDEVLLLGVLVLDDEQVVLAEHPARHPAEQDADLGAGDAAGDRRERAGAHALAEPVGERAQEPLERGDVGPHPAAPGR